ncbi:MAG TPA: MBL fold metallo-hydrolase [Bacteroidales bacterium]|mgnify:FL=1|nr:MBL fold metallo-hydrolase [Bacteroidales bacterium]HQH23459.1 MBL fold metallo-hydrolase [Bacteroidales bacterium]HQJ82035.1 MBL fold metallo-hydrolase [Bacteroidales bacterium]
MTSGSISRNPVTSDIIKTSAGDVEMFFIGHGSLMFKVNDFCIHIDPVRSSGSYDNLPKADLILVTHEHYDHLDPELIADLRKEGTLMFSNGTAASEIKWAKPMAAGDVQRAGGIVIEAVPAYNIVNMRSPGQPFHPKGVGIGFILTIGGKRFYIAGDTENTPEMKALKNIHVAFLPMNLPYTMTPEMVADAARAFKPEILYPYHYGETETGKLVDLLKNTDIEIRIRDLQ